MGKLNEHTLEHVAHRFKILGEPMRLKLLNCLQEGELCVQDLVEQTGAGQANISKHLSMLSSQGILGRRKEGLYVFYFIKDETVYELCDLVCNSLEQNVAGMQQALNASDV